MTVSRAVSEVMQQCLVEEECLRSPCLNLHVFYKLCKSLVTMPSSFDMALIAMSTRQRLATSLTSIKHRWLGTASVIVIIIISWVTIPCHSNMALTAMNTTQCLPASPTSMKCGWLGTAFVVIFLIIVIIIVITVVIIDLPFLGVLLERIPQDAMCFEEDYPEGIGVHIAAWSVQVTDCKLVESVFNLTFWWLFVHFLMITKTCSLCFQLL